MNVGQMLRGLDMFADLTAAELEAVERCVEERAADAGEVLVREGEAHELLYLIESGKVLVYRQVEGREVALAELSAGKVFGEMSLLDDLPPSASVRALEPCRLLAIGRLDLNVLLNWDTILASKMWRSFARMLSRRLRDTNDSMLQRLQAGDEASRELLARAEGAGAANDGV